MLTAHRTLCRLGIHENLSRLRHRFPVTIRQYLPLCPSPLSQLPVRYLISAEHPLLRRFHSPPNLSRRHLPRQKPIQWWFSLNSKPRRLLYRSQWCPPPPYPRLMNQVFKIHWTIYSIPKCRMQRSQRHRLPLTKIPNIFIPVPHTEPPTTKVAPGALGAGAFRAGSPENSTG
jgi:hypothetical protein